MLAPRTYFFVKEALKMETRTEFDSIGSAEIPAHAYYGIQTLRASSNFDITRRPMNKEYIMSLVAIKKAAAIANFEAKDLPEDKYQAIIQACDYILCGHLMEEFIVDAIQGGAGTSANMNANEVIANKALEIMGHRKGEYGVIHPNDHVNMSQSTNDVCPTAGKITAIKLLSGAVSQLERLKYALEQKSFELRGVVKMGRTQLQDAVPVTLGQVFQAYSCCVGRDIRRLRVAQDELRTVNIGGTAIGTCVNAGKAYFGRIAECVSLVTGVKVVQAQDLIDATQNLDCFVYVSGILKTCAVNLSKMSNDLRLMSSGPRTGLSEINLPPMQNGSSIMPGKINPVIPEVVTQVAFHIIGNDTAITMAAEAGQLELNAFEPVLFYNLFESIQTLERAVKTLVEHCILGITANERVCAQLLEKSVGVVTALCPQIGYIKASELAKKSLKTGISIKNILLDEHILSSQEIDSLLDPAALTSPLSRYN